MPVIDIKTKRELSSDELSIRSDGVPREGGYILFYRDQADGLYKARYRGAGADMVMFTLVYSWMLAQSLYPIAHTPREI